MSKDNITSSNPILRAFGMESLSAGLATAHPTVFLLLSPKPTQGTQLANNYPRRYMQAKKSK